MSEDQMMTENTTVLTGGLEDRARLAGRETIEKAVCLLLNSIDGITQAEANESRPDVRAKYAQVVALLLQGLGVAAQPQFVERLAALGIVADRAEEVDA